jgi:hypothetical protein
MQNATPADWRLIPSPNNIGGESYYCVADVLINLRLSVVWNNQKPALRVELFYGMSWLLRFDLPIASLDSHPGFDSMLNDALSHFEAAVLALGSEDVAMVGTLERSSMPEHMQFPRYVLHRDHAQDLFCDSETVALEPLLGSRLNARGVMSIRRVPIGLPTMDIDYLDIRDAESC